MSTKYLKTAWVNDSSPAISASNLNKMEKGIYEGRGFFLDLPYYHKRNVLDIANCESSEGWANNSWDGNVGTYAADTTNYKVGSAGASLSGGTAQNTGIHLVKALDLTKFNDGSTSTTSDWVCFMLYIDATSLTRVSTLEFGVCNDAYDTYVNAKYKRIATSGLVAGWNYVSIKKSDFATYGSGAWSGVTGIDCHAYGSPSAAISFTIDCVYMVRDSGAGIAPTIFQRQINGTWTREFDYDTDDCWFVGLENDELILRCVHISYTTIQANYCHLSGYANGSGMQFADDNWCIQAKLEIKTANESYWVGMQETQNDKILIKVTAGTFGIYAEVAGVGATSETTALSLAVGDILDLKLVRSGTSIAAYAVKNGNYDTQYVLTKEWSTAYVASGYLSLGVGSTCYNSIKALSITSSEQVMRASEAEVALKLASKWYDWTPTIDWTGTEPTTVLSYAQYCIIGNTLFFRVSFYTTDGNDCTGVIISLPTKYQPADGYYAPSAIQQVFNTYYNPIPIISNATLGYYYITFGGFQTATNGQTCIVTVQGFYRIL